MNEYLHGINNRKVSMALPKIFKQKFCSRICICCVTSYISFNKWDREVSEFSYLHTICYMSNQKKKKKVEVLNPTI